MEGFPGRSLFLVFIWVTPALTQPCPRGCTCSDVTIDSIVGQSVNCSFSYLQILPRGISPNAFGLDFAKNRLDRIPNGITQLTELRFLNLSKNLMSYQVPSNIFRANTKLKVLDLSENHLQRFSQDSLVGLNQLEKLDLHNNLLRGFPDGIFQPLPLATVVCMGHNHWRCDCDLLYTVRWFLGREGGEWTSICDGGQPECSSPVNSNYGRVFHDIDMGEFRTCPGVYQSTETLTTETDGTTRHATTASEIETSALITTSVESNTLEKKETVIIKPSSGFVMDDKKFKFDEKLILPIAIVSVSALFLVTILAFSMLMCRLVTKRERRHRIRSDSERSRNSTENGSPWPLLQSRRLPALLPNSPVTSTSPLTEYEEIPFSQRELPARCESNGYVFNQITIPLRDKTSLEESESDVKGAYACQIDSTDVTFDGGIGKKGVDDCQANWFPQASNSQLVENYASPVSSGKTSAVSAQAKDNPKIPVELQYTPMKGWVKNAKSVTDLYAPMKEEKQ